MRIVKAVGRWDVEFTTNARCTYRRLKKHVTATGSHWVWGRFSLMIEDGTEEVHLVCAECDQGILRTVSWGDEGLSVCPMCRSIEGATRYVSNRELERGEYCDEQ